ncbi:unnamed protein product [Brassica oleracea]
MTNRLEALYISSNEVTEKSEVQEHQTCEMEQAPLVERSVGVESPVSGEVQEGSIEEKEEDKEKEKEWLDVSPGKSSRSPLKNLKFGQMKRCVRLWQRRTQSFPVNLSPKIRSSSTRS